MKARRMRQERPTCRGPMIEKEISHAVIAGWDERSDTHQAVQSSRIAFHRRMGRAKRHPSCLCDTCNTGVARTKYGSVTCGAVRLNEMGVAAFDPSYVGFSCRAFTEWPPSL